ncbi:recombinase family protein [Pusillimonas sp.]|uniref:recombinase family protein n=1 Tax=Pusillimonas sp. TaxID=3040095 RepID=UPI0037C748DC
MKARMIGYARVSTDDQNMGLQLKALKAINCDKIYTDHGVSGARSSRPGLAQALAVLRPGDKLVVWRLDRLGRSLVNLIQLLEQLGQCEVLFLSLCEQIDTTTSGGRLVFHMIAALAEFERNLISERTRAGMAAARAQGKHLGRASALSPEQCQEARKLLNGGLAPALVAARFKVHPRTLQRRLAKL